MRRGAISLRAAAVSGSSCNPFDPAAVAVIDAAPANDGEVVYDTAGRVGVGYEIVGLGRDALLVTTLTNGS